VNDVLLLAALQAADADDWGALDKVLALASDPAELARAVKDNGKGDGGDEPAATFRGSS
jgi:hypothetical protein